MSEKERTRYHLLNLVKSDRLTLIEASVKMDLSYRHSKRVYKRFKVDGARGLIHGNRGRASPLALPLETKARILDLSRSKYELFNDSHFTEKLEKQEGIEISREKVRQIRRAAGIKPKRKRKPKKHYKRRPRKAQEGVMVLWDGSPHQWFGPDRPPCCLMSVVDDATSKLLWALFIEYEGTHGYLSLLKGIVSRYGLPSSIYQDRHGSLKRNDDHWSLQEQLAGAQEPTQVGKALEELGIKPIFALTPQAKGRVERLFGVLQDRLIAELALEGIKDIQRANDFLKHDFIEDYNDRFAVKAKESESAWRKLSAKIDIEKVISFRYQAVVGNDNAVRLGDIVIDIPEGPRHRGYAQARVDVRQLLDGSWRVYHQDKLIAEHESTVVNEPIRARPRRKYHVKAAEEMTWVYLQSAPSTDETWTVDH